MVECNCQSHRDQLVLVPPSITQSSTGEDDGDGVGDGVCDDTAVSRLGDPRKRSTLTQSIKTTSLQIDIRQAALGQINLSHDDLSSYRGIQEHGRRSNFEQHQLS